MSVNQRSVLTPRVVPKDYTHRPPSLNACAAAMSPRVWETVDYVLGHAKARSSSAEPGRRTPLVLHAACRPRLQPHEPHKPAQPSRLRITRPASAAQLSLRRRAARWAPHMRALRCSRAAPYRTQTAFHYGFIPLIIVLGLRTEPRPSICPRLGP